MSVQLIITAKAGDYFSMISIISMITFLLSSNLLSSISIHILPAFQLLFFFHPELDALISLYVYFMESLLRLST